MLCMTRSAEAWTKFLATRVVGLVADGVVLAAAYWGAFALRFDFHAPRWGWRAVALSFVTVAPSASSSVPPATASARP